MRTRFDQKKTIHTLHWMMIGLLVAASIGKADAGPPEDALLALNKASLSAYSVGQTQFTNNSAPVILVGSELTFIVNGIETKESYTPQSYTTTKSLSHLLLGTVAVLEPFADNPVPNRATWVPKLQAMQSAATAVIPYLSQLGLSPDSQKRNKFYIEQILAFIKNTLQSGAYTREQLTKMARPLAPLALANANDAARDQIELLNATVTKWRDSVPAGIWSKTTVVIEVPKQPRKDYLQGQYFQNLLGDTSATQMMYAENIFDQPSAIKLLGTVLLDRAIATTVFNDKFRLERDFLGDAATADLLRLFGKLGKPLPSPE